MNLPADLAAVAQVLPHQRGVLAKADLQTLLAEPHPTAFVRRVQALERAGAIRRFVRGFYVGPEFDLPTLSQRLAPDSYVTGHTVLARELIVGPRADRQVIAAKVGRARTYRSLGYEVRHLSLAPHLHFGIRSIDGVRFADAEKATLDTLYFHLRGHRQPFDVHGDLALERLDRRRLRKYLRHYRNPKFVTFAGETLGLLLRMRVGLGKLADALE